MQTRNWVTLLATSDRRGGTFGRARKRARPSCSGRRRWPTPSAPARCCATACSTSPAATAGCMRSTAATGKERWRFQAAAPMHSTPAISGNLVLFGCDDGRCMRLIATSGRLAWKAEAAAPSGPRRSCIATCVYFGIDRRRVHGPSIAAAAGSAGAARWMAGCARPPYATERLVYVGCGDGRLVRARARVRQGRLDLPGRRRVVASPARRGRSGAGRLRGLLLLRPRRGTPAALRWKFETGLGITSSAAVAGGKVFFGGKDGHLYALSAADGSETVEVASRCARSPPRRSPATRSSAFRRSTARPRRSRANTGKELWRASLGGSLQSTPIVTDEAVYLATYPGVVYALR